MTKKSPREFKYPTRLRHAKAELADLTRNKYFRHIPIGKMDKILNKWGFDTVTEGYILCGHDGRAKWPLYDKVEKKQRREHVVVVWHRMPSNKREVTIYIN